MGLRGPAPQSRTTLEARGSWRARGRVDPPGARGRPKRPRALAGDARKFWDAIVPGLVRFGVVGKLDAFALQACCELWGLYRRALAAAAADPADKNARVA